MDALQCLLLLLLCIVLNICMILLITIVCVFATLLSRFNKVAVKSGLSICQTLGFLPFRCTIQLTILGYILVPIFSYDRWWLVLLYAGFMITIAGAEAVSRPSTVYRVDAHSCIDRLDTNHTTTTETCLDFHPDNLYAEWLVSASSKSPTQACMLSAVLVLFYICLDTCQHT